MSDHPVRPLPATIEEIDAAWLTAALRTNAPAATVNHAQIVDINHGTCTKIRMRLDLNEAARRAGIPKLVMLKGGFEPHSHDMWHMHQSEVRGYRDVIPVLKLNSPACYFADYDPERRQSIIIMEDLVARGVTFCHPLEPQAYEPVARRLTMFARHHAKTWGSEELLPGGRWDWCTDIAAFSPAFFKQFFEPETWRRFLDSPRAAAASVHFNSQSWMAHALDRMAILSAQLPHSVVHGDTHLGNLYVDPDGTPGFFDSLPKRAPAMLEIAYHVGGALDPLDRRRWERPLVQHYLDELVQNGVTPPSIEEAMRQFGVFLVLGYLVFLFNESIFQTETINTAYTARFSTAMLDHDTIGLLDAIN